MVWRRCRAKGRVEHGDAVVHKRDALRGGVDRGVRCGGGKGEGGKFGKCVPHGSVECVPA